MKKLIFMLSLFSAFSVWARNASLDPAVKMVESCLETEKTLLCNDGITDVLRSVSLDARGEFVYYLKDELNKNENEKVIMNLFDKLQVLVPVYEKLDGCDQWSCRDLKIFLGDVSIRFVKITPVNSVFYSDLYKKQAVQSGRYGLLQAILERSTRVTTLFEMDEMTRFGEFAKEWSRSVHDEYYLYQSAVEIVRKMTMKSLKLRPGHEGIYEVKFTSPETNDLKIDRVVIMESNDRDALVVSFVASQSRLIKFSFTGSGVLGNRFFSNEDVYNDQADLSLPFFKLDLDRKTKTIKGVFSTARFGEMSFTGNMLDSNMSVYDQKNVSGLIMDQLLGKYIVKVGEYDMTLVLKKRSDERTLVEAALYNDDAMISFSKVSLDSERGILSIVDTKNQRKLTLGITEFKGHARLKGQLLNAAMSKVMSVESL
jgi:hypothetical protein